MNTSKTMTDTDRIDFIERQLDRGGFKCVGGANMHGQPQYDPIEIFTVITQHIRAKSLREVLDRGIAKAALEAGK